MENSQENKGERFAEESGKLNPAMPVVILKESKVPESVKLRKHTIAGPVVSRAHDFAHVHPSHARHKTFGMDHEPGAF